MTHLTDTDLNLYLDSALESSQLAEFNTHLAACSACAARLERLQLMFASLESLPDVGLQRDLAAGVVAHLNAARGAPPRVATPPAFRGALALQAMLALILMALSAPLASQFLPSLPFAELTAQASLALNDLLAIDVPDLRPMLAPESIPTLGKHLPAVPAVTLLLLAGAAGILWLVGNGLLLRSSSHPQRR